MSLSPDEKAFSRKLKVDEKAIALRPLALKEKAPKEKKSKRKHSSSKARAKRHTRKSKSLPKIKFNDNGTPKNVDLDRFNISQKFFAGIKKLHHRPKSSQDF